MSIEDTVITITDCRDVGFCVTGSVAYLDSIGLNFKSLRNGEYTVGYFLTLGDANATIVANRAIQRANEQVAE